MTNISRQTLFAIVAFALLLCLFPPSAARGQARSSPAGELPRADDPSGSQTGVPDYVLTTLSGTELRLSALRGRVVLLDFFTATCPHCRAHAPFVAGLAKRYGERGLVVLNLCPHSPYAHREMVEEYARLAGIENEVVFSPSELMMSYMAADANGVYGVPQAILFDRSGRVVARFMNWDEGGQQAIEQAITRQLDAASPASRP